MRTAGDSLQGLVCFLQLFRLRGKRGESRPGFLPHVAAGFRRRASRACETPDGRTGFGSPLATKSKSRRRGAEPARSLAPALLEGDPSFARGCGETNRARGGLEIGMFHETFVLLLPMFHVKHSATAAHGRGGAASLAPAEGLAWSAAPPRALSGDALVEHEDREPQVVEDDAHADGSDEGGDYGCRGPELPAPRAPAHERGGQRHERADGHGAEP